METESLLDGSRRRHIEHLRRENNKTVLQSENHLLIRSESRVENNIEYFP